MNYMHYRSTRGGEKKPFADILSSGLAEDGGLYEPLSWPHQRRLRRFLAANPTFPQVVGAVVGVFAGRRSLPHLDFTAIAHKAFEGFHSRAVVPLREVERDLWLLELFHGPTLSFKDIPLQFYGQLLEALSSTRRRLLIMIGATSGDTGSAAIEALKHVRGIRLFMLHPKDGISAQQRKQMTSVQAPHICNIAVEGSYDDCLRLVKEVAPSEKIRAHGEISAVNSFNWIRIAVQSAIYLYATQQIPQRHKAVRFALASGNFGNAYAGYVAKKLGANIHDITLAVSHNDFLHNLFQSGSATSSKVVPSLAPSIDIMTPNNIERLLFRSLGDSVRKWRKLRERTEENQTLRITKSVMRSDIFQLYRSQRFDDEQIFEAMSQAYDSVGVPLDPHSAIALAAAKDAIRQDEKRKERDLCTIAFATASAAKFPETVERIIGTRPHIPPRLAETEQRTEDYETISADSKVLEDIVVARLRKPLDSDASVQSEEVVVATSTATVAALSTTPQKKSEGEGEEQVAKDAGEEAGDATADEEAGDATAGEEAGDATADEEAAGEPEEISEKTDATLATRAGESPSPSEAVFASPESSPESSIESSPESSIESSAAPAMPAVAALTQEEDFLEKKIAKLKEQTTQLDETLGTPVTGSPSSTDRQESPFPTPPLASPSPFDDAPATNGTTSFDEEQHEPQPSPPSSSAERVESLSPERDDSHAFDASPAFDASSSAESVESLSHTPRSDDKPTTFGQEGEAEESKAETQNVYSGISSDISSDVSSDDSIVSLADAAEQGQASLQEKIAQLREQSEKLDEAAEQARAPFVSDNPSPFSRPLPPRNTETSGAESSGAENLKETSTFVGAENFFPQSTEATKRSETISSPSDSLPDTEEGSAKTSSWETAPTAGSEENAYEKIDEISEEKAQDKS